MLIGKDKRTGYEEVTGQKTETAKYLYFEFYNLVWWWDQPDKPNATDEPKSLAHLFVINHSVV